MNVPSTALACHRIRAIKFLLCSVGAQGKCRTQLNSAIGLVMVGGRMGWSASSLVSSDKYKLCDIVIFQVSEIPICLKKIPLQVKVAEVKTEN